MDFESILEEIFLGRGQGNLKLKPKQKEARAKGDCFWTVEIVKLSEQLQNHWNERLGLINKRVLFSSHNLMKSVVNQTVNWKQKC